MEQKLPHLDFACVIHGDLYSFDYVLRLQAMIQRHWPGSQRLHVWTEADREVPNSMTRHVLTPWPGVAGHRSAWWYKMQMFRPESSLGQILYLDLDTVIISDLGWIQDLDPRKFWAPRDFRRLQRDSWSGINSSVMYWHQPSYTDLWQAFEAQGVDTVRHRYAGDQDFIGSGILGSRLEYMPESRINSWRWQVSEGGWDFRARRPRAPGQPAWAAPDVSVLVFHGRPKPHEVNDPMITSAWR